MKVQYFSFAVLSCLLIASCQKDNGVKISAKNASLIAGKWQAYQRHTVVYRVEDNAILKDTVVNYNAANNINWWFEIYEANGNAFVTGKPYTINNVLKADTTAFLNYAINGASLMLKPKNGGSENKSIISITETDMTLKKVYNSLPRLNWGLDLRTEYKFVEQTFYKKQ
ncbi:hypothetical protein [Mucilaginibacter auburnensis]|uniref:Lipocalin-like protein n=1 Tax=Mucilaginibacter auburnensis TaxID=1457233 RepID=A0A2H9VVT8_9SPHI|nr:hypothetical protein [Mucilaginibacter auburnensis]PJJ84934.1 hypothetical protein CLV57_1956 [Mucilaginibacter auburnensis]